MARKTLLISIKPRYAAMIFEGTKTVELRRTEPRVGKGDKLIVYVSSPTKEVAGKCTVAEVEKDSPENLWLRIRDKAGVTKREFDDYFDGATQAVAIHLHKPKRFGTPVCLVSLRQGLSLQPPQSFRYVETEDWSSCA